MIENKGYVNDIGVDGWPIDANHPVNKLGIITLSSRGVGLQF